MQGTEQQWQLPGGRWTAASIAVCAALYAAIALQYRAQVLDATRTQAQEASRETARRQARALEIELQKFSLVPLLLAENPVVRDALIEPTLPAVANLNKTLESLAKRTGAPYLYVVNSAGRTVASSNHARPDSFVGRDYQFRPYFSEAMADGSSEYFAKGERTGKSGLFLARRVDRDQRHLGVVIVKVEFAEITELWKSPNATTFAANDDGIVLFSSDPSLDHTLLFDLSAQRRAQILATKQFGAGPLQRAALTIDDDLNGIDAKGRRIQATVLDVPGSRWKLYRTEQITPALDAADNRVRLQTAVVGLLLACLGTLVLWRWFLAQQRARLTTILATEVDRQTQQLSKANAKLAFEMDERKRINSSFRKAREELAQANRLGSIGAITASVAHEVNQPVAAIRAFAENAGKLLQRDDVARARENIDSIVTLTERIGRITNELRRYARRGTQTIEPVAVRDIVDGVELLMGDRIRDAGIDFRLQGPVDELPRLHAGRVRLEQVLVNVIQNALEAMDEQSGGIIEMALSTQSGHVNFTISDNGPGISDEMRAEIFTPFHTDKPDGLGIGLGIAKDIVTEFGGSIEIVESALGGAAIKIGLRTV